MSYPISWREMVRAATNWAEEKYNATRVFRKSGFEPTATGDFPPTPILSLTQDPNAGTPPAEFLAKYVSQRERANFDPFARSVVVTGQDGIAYVKGANESGQFGLGHTSTVADWTPVPDLPPLAKAVYAASVIFFITEDGDVYAAGDNDYGEIGTGTVGDVDTPTLLGIPEPVVHVDGTANQTYHALTDSGKLYTWGEAYRGMIGNGDVDPVFPNTRIVTEPFYNSDVGLGVAEVACGRSWTLYRKTDGSVWGFGLSDVATVWIDLDPFAYPGPGGPLDPYTTVPTPTELPLGRDDCVGLSAGGLDVCYVFSDGTAKVSEQDNTYNRWEDPTPQLVDFHPDGDETLYGQVLNPDGTSVSTATKCWTRHNGEGHALRLDDGSLFSFGRNDRFDLGNGTDTGTFTGSNYYLMMKMGTTLLADDPIAFSGKTTYLSTTPKGDYYVVNADGTLLYWSDSSPAAINDELVGV